MMAPVTDEKMVYLLDPIGASRRPAIMAMKDRFFRTMGRLAFQSDEAVELPWIPPFLQKHGGFVFSLGQFQQWVAARLMETGLAQLWPASPVKAPLWDGDRVIGVRLVDQGTDKKGHPGPAYMPGMDVKARLTVVGDGPVGEVGQCLSGKLGLPEGHHRREWALGMKAVVDLPENCAWKPGTVLHTFGYPEPEIFGFLYVYPERVASLGIFVPSLLQLWMKHPYLWKQLEGATLRSWGAKSLDESGQQGEPFLCGDGWARIGEGSGSTNVLAGSGVDEAWTTGVQLAEGVFELMKDGRDFTRENLDAAYVKRRRASWVEKEARIAAKSRDGFRSGFIKGFMGMGLTGMTQGLVNLGGPDRRPYERIPSFKDYYGGILSDEEIASLAKKAKESGEPFHDLFLQAAGWPAIEPDGKLLVSHQDALLLGGKVQAAEGYADHVIFRAPEVCKSCESMLCVSMCSGQAITPGEDGVPVFDREKCVHCGACQWNCARPNAENPEETNVAFRAGSGGFHSAEN
jgi:electron-transferring-flavoprotein dehydrogenase